MTYQVQRMDQVWFSLEIPERSKVRREQYWPDLTWHWSLSTTGYTISFMMVEYLDKIGKENYRYFKFKWILVKVLTFHPIQTYPSPSHWPHSSGLCTGCTAGEMFFNFNFKYVKIIRLQTERWLNLILQNVSRIPEVGRWGGCVVPVRIHL